MADIPQPEWSETAADNINPAPDGWPPNSLPTIVYQSDREMMGAIKREWDRNNPTITSGGSANAQTLNYTVEPLSYVQGMRFSFIAGFSNTDGATLEVGTLGPKDIFFGALPLSGGEIVAGQIVEVFYDGTHFQISGSSSGTSAASTLQTFLAAPTNDYHFRLAQLLTFDQATARLEQVPMPPNLIISGVDDRALIGPTYKNSYYRMKASDWMNGPVIVSLGGLTTDVVTIGIADIAINKPYLIALNNCVARFDPGAFGLIGGFGTATGTMMECSGTDTFILLRITSTTFRVIAANILISATTPVSGWTYYQTPDSKYVLMNQITILGSGQGTLTFPTAFNTDTNYFVQLTAEQSDNTKDGSVYCLVRHNGSIDIKSTFTVSVNVMAYVYNVTRSG